MRSSHSVQGQSLHRVFGDFRAGSSESFQLTIKIRRNRSIYRYLMSGPFFFHGFLRPISRAREIENDEFHGHFTG